MTALQVSAQKALRSIIERVENIQQQQRDLGADIKEILAEAKNTGFDVKQIKKVIAIRKLGQAEYEEQQAILDTYMAACGLSGTPLGEYAERQPEAVN